MGIFDKKEGSIFGDKPEPKSSGRGSASPDFSDTTSGSSKPAPGAAPRASGTPRADFSDVTTGESTEAPAPSSTGGKTYTVKSGDSLSKIAKAEYGDASKWKQIYEANKDKIKNPDLIYPGQEFTIPD